MENVPSLLSVKEVGCANAQLELGRDDPAVGEADRAIADSYLCKHLSKLKECLICRKLASLAGKGS